MTAGMEALRTGVTATVTMSVLGIMGYGVLRGIDVGVFEQYGAIVIGYWFGANAQGAVTRAVVTAKNIDVDKVPSVL